MCPDRELLSAWLDGEVPSPWNDTIDRHVRECAGCAAAAASLRAVRDAFAADSASLDAAAEAAALRVSARLASSAPSLGSSPRLSALPREASVPLWKRRFAVPLPLAAAAVLAIALPSAALVATARKNTELRVAVRQAVEATPVSAEGIGMDTILDYLSSQDSTVNINITLPSDAFAGSAGEPVILREADYWPGTGR